jgi:alpha-mannosidase
VSNPFVAVSVPGNPAGPLPQDQASLIHVAEPNVLVTGVKLADDGEGLIVRLWELAGRSTTAHLRLDPHIAAARAQTCSLVEEARESLTIRDGVIEVPARGSGLATVRIQ